MSKNKTEHSIETRFAEKIQHKDKDISETSNEEQVGQASLDERDIKEIKKKIEKLDEKTASTREILAAIKATAATIVSMVLLFSAIITIIFHPRVNKILSNPDIPFSITIASLFYIFLTVIAAIFITFIFLFIFYKIYQKIIHLVIGNQ